MVATPSGGKSLSFSAAPAVRALGGYRLELLDFSDVEHDREVREKWETLLDEYEHPNLLYSSAAWASYIVARGGKVDVVVVRDRTGNVAGIVPIVRHRFALSYDVSSASVAKAPVFVADVLGSVPFVPSDDRLLVGLVEHILDAWPECDAVFCESLPIEHGYWQLADRKTDEYLLYCPSGIGPTHLIELSTSFEDYVRRWNAKFRYNVQRAARKLQAAGPGRLELVCCRSPEQVDDFFEQASEVRRRSRQHAALGDLDAHFQTSRAGLIDLAQRGLLRSYLLRAGARPCAFAIGCQYRGIYFYGAIGYDVAYARHSPGNTLLYLLLKDLVAFDPPRLMSFGKGDQDYKRRFGTRSVRVGSCFLFRRTLQNSLRVQSHALFTDLVAIIQRLPQEWSPWRRSWTKFAQSPTMPR